MKFTRGQYVKCVNNENANSLLTFGNQYQVTDFGYDKEVGQFLCTVIANDGIYHLFLASQFVAIEDDLTIKKNNLIQHIFHTERDPNVFKNNLVQIFNFGENLVGIPGMIFYLEHFLKLYKAKQDEISFITYER